MSRFQTGSVPCPDGIETVPAGKVSEEARKDGIQEKLAAFPIANETVLLGKSKFPAGNAMRPSGAIGKQNGSEAV